MWRQTFFLAFLMFLAVTVQADTDNDERELQGRIFDRFYPEDVCENLPGIYGFCDQSRFPQCQEGRELICYNRKPMRNRFHKDNRQPYYYIDYNTVFCYPSNWSGCASCAPGRFCASENRCILDKMVYPCERWF